MNAGVIACALPIPVLLVVGLVFALLKGRAAVFVSGFNFFSERDRANYDTDAISRDMRNACFLWILVFAAGCLLSYAISPYMAIIAYAVFLVLVFKDVRADPETGFAKYRKQ